MALPPDTELLETLGEGSFGRVYVARVAEGPLRRTVVLKVLKGEWVQHDEVLLRARDEAALLARLHHDNIVKVEQLTTLNGRPAVVMEHVQGLSLDRVLRSHGPLPCSVALEVCAKVASALDAAWFTVPPGESKPLRVVHRDIKPSNIILSVHGAVKVLDFGTARAQFDAREASTRSLTFGSLPYMAPECFDGGEPTPAVDVYALGATLYELVSGVPLGKLSVNPREHGAALQRRLEALRPSDLNGVPQSLDALRDLIGWMLRYELGRRPTARAVRDQCRSLLGELPGRPIRIDQFAEAVVDPLYRSREATPPPAQGTTGKRPPEHSTLLPSTPSPAGPKAVTADPKAALSNDTISSPAPATRPRADEFVFPWKALGALVLASFLLGLLLLGALHQLLKPTPAPALTAAAEPPSKQPLATEASETPKAPEPEEKPPVPTRKDKQKSGQATASTDPSGSGGALPATEQAPVEPKPQPTRQAAKVTVSLKSLPAEAQVSAGGESFTCPETAQLPAGDMRVSVKFPDGGASGSCSLKIVAGNTYIFKDSDGTLVCP